MKTNIYKILYYRKIIRYLANLKLYATKMSTNKNSIIYFQVYFLSRRYQKLVYLYTSQHLLKTLASMLKSKIFISCLRVISSFLQNKDSVCCYYYSGKCYVCLLRRVTVICHASAHVLFATKSGSMITFIIVI